jgi:arylsulfatase
MITLGEAMKLAGYHTAMTGKWHLMKTAGGSKSKVAGDWIDRYVKTTHPYFRGFDSYYGLLDGCCNFFNPSQPDPAYKGGAIRKFGRNDQAITEFDKGFYTTDAFTDDVIARIREYSSDRKPFFLHLCYTAPHYPLHARPKDIAKYRGKFKMGWEQMRKDRWARQQAMGLTNDTWTLTEGDPKAYSWEGSDHNFEDERMAVYAAMIDRVDQNIGRIHKALKATGQADNTLIIFLSDNGGCSEEPGGRDSSRRKAGPGNDYVAVGPSWGWAQNAPFRRYKSWVYEGGVTTPMIAWWPGHVPANTINRSPAHIMDLLPTFLDLADTPYPTKYKGHEILPVEGESMTPLLAGKSRKMHDLYWYWSRNRAVRQGDMKLVWDNSVRVWELYNIAEDRCEANDLAGNQPELVKRMADDWFAWAKEMELKITPDGSDSKKKKLH